MVSVISFRRYIVRYQTRGPQKSDDNLDDNLLETFVTHCEPRSTCHEPSGSSMTCNVCTSLLCESPTIPDTLPKCDRGSRFKSAYQSASSTCVFCVFSPFLQLGMFFFSSLDSNLYVNLFIYLFFLYPFYYYRPDSTQNTLNVFFLSRKLHYVFLLSMIDCVLGKPRAALHPSSELDVRS